MLSKLINSSIILLFLISCSVVNVEQVSDSQTTSGEISSDQPESSSELFTEVPSDIPVPSDASNFLYAFKPPFVEPHNKSCSEFLFRTGLTHAELTEFYLQGMSNNNWQLAGREDKNNDTNLYFEKNNQRVGVFITAHPTRDAVVNINFSDWFYSSSCVKTPDDIPLPGEFRGSFSTDFYYSYSQPQKGSTFIEFRTIYSPQEVADFFSKNLTQHGWELECIHGEDESYSYYLGFIKPGRETESQYLIPRDHVFIQIVATDGEMGGTVVDMDFELPSNDPQWAIWCFDNPSP